MPNNPQKKAKILPGAEALVESETRHDALEKIARGTIAGRTISSIADHSLHTVHARNQSPECSDREHAESQDGGRLLKPKADHVFDANAFLSKIGQGRTLGEYRRNQKVFSQGDPGDAVFYIQTGRVKLTIVSEQGKEAVIAILDGGEFFGEGCLAGQPRRIATATAISACSIMRLEKTGIVRVLKDEQTFSQLFLTYLLARNVRFEGDLVDQLFNSSEKRLARVLLQLANFGKEKSEHVIPKISQETLAEIVGTTRSRVNFFMNKFRKLGLIEYNGGLTVHSSLLNIVLPD